MNPKRMLENFERLVGIDCPSGQERAMADEIRRYLGGLGLAVHEDGAGTALGTGCGNLMAELPGDASRKTILLCSHMDTVSPGLGKSAVRDGGVYRSGGESVLGADDAAGTAIILELFHSLIENPAAHGCVKALFTVGEEVGLAGSRQLKAGDISADLALVLDDHGEAGQFIHSAPAHERLSVRILGKAAHAGVEPEKGIDSLQILARAVQNMRLGRIDDETTANIGTIHGGKAMNIVCPELELVGEARSRDLEKLERQVEAMRRAFADAAAEAGGEVLFGRERLYYPIRLGEDSELSCRLSEAARRCGLPLKPVSSGGGSDASVLVGLGIPACAVSVGYRDMHSVNEILDINEFIKAAELVEAFVLL